MEQFYSLPEYGNLIIFDNFFYFELYLLIFTALVLFFFFKKYRLINLVLIIWTVVLYKYLNFTLFWWCSCSENQYLPSLGFINTLVWIITVWNIAFSLFITSKFCKSESWIFLWSTILAYIFSIINELVVRWFWLRVYSEDTEKLLSWNTFLSIPLESYLYILVWVIFMITTYNYLEKVSIKESYKKLKTKSLKKLLWFSFFWVFLMEVLMHPIIINKWMPDFTYFYQDLNWVFTIVWSVIIFWVIYFIDNVITTKKLNLEWYKELWIYIFIISIINFIQLSILFNVWILSFAPATNSYLWWINIFNIPIELLFWSIVMNILLITFILRNYNIKN